ncbi:MAG: protein kinase [Candidatus Margulisiibacteriota bacterium]
MAKISAANITPEIMRRFFEKRLPKVSCQRTTRNLDKYFLRPIMDGKTDCEPKVVNLATQALLRIDILEPTKPLESTARTARVLETVRLDLIANRENRYEIGSRKRALLQLAEEKVYQNPKAIWAALEPLKEHPELGLLAKAVLAKLNPSSIRVKSESTLAPTVIMPMPEQSARSTPTSSQGPLKEVFSPLPAPSLGTGTEIMPAASLPPEVLYPPEANKQIVDLQTALEQTQRDLQETGVQLKKIQSLATNFYFANQDLATQLQGLEAESISSNQHLLTQISELETTLLQLSKLIIKPDVRPSSLTQRYVFLKELGRGGMAVASVVFDVVDKRLAVLKAPLPAHLEEEGIIRRFEEREIQAMANLSPLRGVVHFIEALNLEHVPYEKMIGTPLGEKIKVKMPTIPCISMEYVSYPTLGEVLKDNGNKLPTDRALKIALALVKILEVVHKNGIIHRDLKPDNIFIVPDEKKPGEETVKIADFGIVQLTGVSGPKITQEGWSIGTPAYMPPEQWKGEKDIDGRADQYAVGAILYEMLAGKPPFSECANENFAIYGAKVLAATSVEDIRMKVNVSDQLATVLNHMLAKDRNMRYPTCQACIAALETLLPPA